MSYSALGVSRTRNSCLQYLHCALFFRIRCRCTSGSGLAGTIIGVVVGFIVLVVLSIYGYSVYWWREHGLYGNVKPSYKYSKAISKDDDDANVNRALADAPFTSTASSIPLVEPRETALVEPTTPIPIAAPVKPPVVPAATANTTATPTAIPASKAPPAVAATTPASPPAKSKLPAISTRPPTLSATTPHKPTTATPTTPTTPARPTTNKPPVSPSGVRLGAAAAGRVSAPATPTSPKSPSGGSGLPEGWSLHKDASGNQYYFNTSTGQSQWSRPTGSSKPAQ